MESSRKVDINYRGILVRDVCVTSIFNEVEMRIATVLKCEAIRQDLLLPIGAEMALGCVCGPASFTAKLAEETISQASLCAACGLVGWGGGLGEGMYAQMW